MHLLVIILNIEEYLDNILSSLLEVGIINATVIESMRMTEILSHDVPIFAALRQMRRGSSSYNRVIIAPLKKKEVIDELLAILKTINIDLKESETGFLFTIPIEDFISYLDD